MGPFTRDVRYVLRDLYRHKLYTSAVTLILSLAIGANSALFSILQQVVGRPLPVLHPAELWSLGDHESETGDHDIKVFSYECYKYLRDNSSEFANLAAFHSGWVDLSVRRQEGLHPADHYYGKLVSGNYFRTLGISVLYGRTIDPSDERPGSPLVAVISYRAWRYHFASDEAIIGESLVVKDIPVTVVGIAPPGFFGETVQPNPPDFWLPLSAEPALYGIASQLDRWNKPWLYIIGRLSPGYRAPVVQAHLTTEIQQWFIRNPDAKSGSKIEKLHIVLTSASHGLSRLDESYKYGLNILFAAAALVLLLACANAANLMLVRNRRKLSMMALQLALGANRRRIVQTVLIEGIVLALLAGAIGVCIAIIAMRLLLFLAFPESYVPISLSPSWPLIAFALMLSVLTGGICSLAPLILVSEVPPADLIRRTTRGTSGLFVSQQNTLIILQTAVAFALVTCAAVLMKSLAAVEAQDLGFQTEKQVVVAVVPPIHHPLDHLHSFYRDVQDELLRIPGVESVSLSMLSPMDGNSWQEPVLIAGQDSTTPLPRSRWPWENRVSSHYFETLGIRILRGRAINENDRPDSPLVAVVNRQFVRSFLDGGNAIGKRFGIGEPAHRSDYEIVGICDDAKYEANAGPANPMFFLPLSQRERAYIDSAQEMEQLRSHYIGSIQLRVASRPEQFQDAARKTLSNIDPKLILLSTRTLAHQADLNLTSQRSVAQVTSIYALFALVLASIGLYGTVAYSVANRLNEIGIRIALGASRTRIVGLIVSRAVLLTAVGLLIGIPTAIVAGRLVEHELFGMVRVSLPIILATACLLSICGALAALIPAWRASLTQPAQVLRAE